MKLFIGLLLLACSEPVFAQSTAAPGMGKVATGTGKAARRDSVPAAKRDTMEETLQNVIISSTRTNQLLKNTPIAVQVIGREDIEEGTAQSPANIRELLTELSGTQMQQTSAVSGNVTIRLQGLDGRYTQLLKDGFPLYGGFSGSLSILQVPPLDLRQVEVIKGAGSALYGGDGIAGIINLISRTPDTAPHLDAILNQTNRGGTDLGGFYSLRGRHTGLTILGTASRQGPFDVNKDGFTDLPLVWQGTINPTFFSYPDDSSTLRLGVNLSSEDRLGGDLEAVRHGVDSLHPFRQHNHTDRDYYQLSYEHKGHDRQSLSLKNSIGYFYRSIGQTMGSAGSGGAGIGGSGGAAGGGAAGGGLAGGMNGVSTTGFSGGEISSFTEASYAVSRGAHQLVAGAGLVTDAFRPDAAHAGLGYTHTTAGVFAQDDWTASKRITLEAGARADVERTVYFLPRLALLYRPVHGLVVRVGGGLAYKLPTIFNAADEEDAYQQVYPISSLVRAERSASANLSFNYQGYIGDAMRLTIDQNFYYTRLTDALIPQPDSLQKGWLYYLNAPGVVLSRGSETNARLSLSDLSLYLGYTYTDARREYLPGSPVLPLTPKNRLVSTLSYEEEGRWKAGIEGFFTGAQVLDDGGTTPSFWRFDVMVQKSWGHCSLLLNVENFTDIRQSHFGPLHSGTMQNPVFDEVYAPLDGRVVSLAFRYRR